MKNLLFLSLILISAQAYAACPIDENGSCSVAGLMQEPLHRSYYRSSPMVKEFSETPATKLQPTKTDESINQLRTFGASQTNYSYNTSCLFGICKNTGTPTIFPSKND